MDQLKALGMACTVAADRCGVTLHQADSHWGIRLWGCQPETAIAVGREIEAALGIRRDPETGQTPPAKGLVVAAGFACVWMA